MENKCKYSVCIYCGEYTHKKNKFCFINDRYHIRYNKIWSGCKDCNNKLDEIPKCCYHSLYTKKFYVCNQCDITVGRYERVKKND